MPSQSVAKFQAAVLGSAVLQSFHNGTTLVTPDAAVVGQTCLRAAIAQGVECWEGYIEGVLREFVVKTRLNAQRRAWPLIAQFEAIVDKLASDLNTPTWDKTRELLMTITGIDPMPSWVWGPKFTNPTDTKQFFDGVLSVRHAFAHGFSVPHSVPGLSLPGVLDAAYTTEALECIRFFVTTTDALLEHELRHRHACMTGWN